MPTEAVLTGGRGRINPLHCAHPACVATVDGVNDAECHGCQFGWAE